MDTLEEVIRRRRFPEHMTPAFREQFLSARWRHKNGLEQRLLVALLNAPEVREEALERLSPSDFLTPAYAALAAVLLGPNGDDAARLGVEALEGRPYLPDAMSYDWAAEARELLARILARRERWRAGR